MCREVSPFAGKHWLLKSGSFHPARERERGKKTANSHQIHRKQLIKSQTCWTCDPCPKCSNTLLTQHIIYQVYDLHETEVELNREGLRVVDDGSGQPVVAFQQITEQPALVWPLNRICTYRGQQSSTSSINRDNNTSSVSVTRYHLFSSINYIF